MRYFSSAPSMTCVRDCLRMYLVKLLVKVIKLCSFCHDILVHEEWRLNGCVVPLGEKVEAVLDQGEVQPYAIVGEEIPAMANNFDTTGFLFIATYSVEDFVVGEDIAAFYRRFTCRIPFLENCVVILKSIR